MGDSALLVAGSGEGVRADSMTTAGDELKGETGRRPPSQGGMVPSDCDPRIVGDQVVVSTGALPSCAGWLGRGGLGRRVVISASFRLTNMAF